MATTITDLDDDDLETLATEQRRELTAAKDFDSDLDFAFRLQMEEAINASLSLQPSSSSSSLSSPPPPPPPTTLPKDDVFDLSGLQTEELEKFEQEINDHLLTESETKKMREDLYRRIHDQKVAQEIQRMPEDVWEDCGDEFEVPFGEGCSKNVSSVEIFRVYFKGLVSEERIRGSKVTLAGIGVAICDSRDNLIFELRKPLLGNGMSRQGAEAKALIEGLNAAIALDLKRVVFFCDYHPIYQFVMGRWPPKQRKIATLVHQVALLRGKFTYCNPSLVARNDIKFAFKLAREAIDSQINGPAESSCKDLYEQCVICLEDTGGEQMFSIDGCLHRFCFSCMKQHVEVKLLHGMVPKCPHEGCNIELRIDSCRKFLTPKLIDMMTQRMREASIPVAEKVYCPYPKCSALMSKIEVLEYSRNAFVGAEISGARKCSKCQGHFCVNCKVPWHVNMICSEYRRKNPYPQAEDAKLKTLAALNLWRQCVKCNHMIELAAGCYHMTCRCGYEFCYTCGAEWKNKKATCSCPLWAEGNIIYDEDYFDEDDDDDEEDSDDDDEEYYDSEEDDYYI